MPTITDNIMEMAGLVRDIKRSHHLTEGTILRLIDMNFALAQQRGGISAEMENEFPEATDEEMSMVPPDGEDEVLAAVAPAEETDGQ